MPVPPAVCFGFLCSPAQASSLHRKVTAWARVTVTSGLNLLPPVPFVIPLATAQVTAPA